MFAAGGCDDRQEGGRARVGSRVARRLLADGVRLFIQGGAVLLLALALGAQIATGFAGALLMLLIGTLEES